MAVTCPLCASSASFFSEFEKRQFFLCAVCGLIHLLPAQRLHHEAELERYQLHQNHPSDLRYRHFLDQLLAPLTLKLKKKSKGLDYGCGPGPTVSVMMRERGFQMSDYDPFFFPDRTVLAESYDFIVCTEAAEHFYYPRKEFDQLNQMLKPGGWLGVMTRLYTQSTPFDSWHYVKDPTHVSIYTARTMSWIAEHYGWKLFFPSENVVLFQKG